MVSFVNIHVFLLVGTKSWSDAEWICKQEEFHGNDTEETRRNGEAEAVRKSEGDI